MNRLFAALALAPMLGLLGLTTCQATHACATSDDCDAYETCVYKLGDCAAKGECYRQPAASTDCTTVTGLCGCNGSLVVTGCGYPDGYASGPSISSESSEAGATACTDASADAH